MERTEKEIIEMLEKLQARKTISEPYKEAIAAGIEAIRELREKVNMMPSEAEGQEEEGTLTATVQFANHITTLKLTEDQAENICKAFHHREKPIFAFMKNGEDMVEVDLGKVEMLECEGVGDIELPEDGHAESTYRKSRDDQPQKSVHVHCDECGADYETSVPVYFNRVRCRECHEMVFFKGKSTGEYKDPVNLD